MTLLYVFPHPDDESFGPAPAIARQAREGHAVHVLTLTRGGATRQRHRLRLSVEAMGAVREREMRCVARTLGLAGLTVLDLPDGGLADLDPRRVEQPVREALERLCPEVLVTYAVFGNSGHADHLVVHAAVKRVFCALRDTVPRRAPRRLALFALVEGEMEGAAAHLRGVDPARIGARVAFSAEDRARAEAALACYETYAEVVRKHRPLEQVAAGVAFELFGEPARATPLRALTDALPD
ncbi:MAG: PIG-L deacetylase family protein [Rubricoccaceae bacterium]